MEGGSGGHAQRKNAIGCPSRIAEEPMQYDTVMRVAIATSEYIRIPNGNGKYPKQAMYLTGLQLLAKEMGVRDLRKLLEEQGEARTWQRVSKDLKELSVQARQTALCEFIRDIEECLSRFEPYRRDKPEIATSLM
jgi:N-methylhydantoinase B/oxoprolinase/acetone carboxylase alpha subunit